MKGKLSTHVLDNYFGKPAPGVAWTLEAKKGDQWETLKSGITNADGRTDEPLLQGESLVSGRYRLTFKIDDYYKTEGAIQATTPFLDEIPIEVNLQSGENYHVPLLMTPWSYSTYRGS